LDSEHILAKEARAAGHEPLYATEDIERTVEIWEGVPYHKMFQVGGFNIEMFDAGHVLGSAFYRIHVDGKSIIFSGDLGNSPAPIIRDLEDLPESDYVVMESTYGARVHEGTDTRQKDLRDAIIETVHAGGVLMIPAFALERTQDLLYHIDTLVNNGEIPRVPVYMDSPLAIRLTTIYEKYRSYFNESSSAAVASGNDILNFPGLHSCLTPEESKAINHAPLPKVIIAGSGMSNGGRILHHEMRYLSDPKSRLLIVGYQARGTLGRRLEDGDKVVHIFGVEVQVRAKIHVMNSYSAHADGPHLLAWIAPRKDTIKKIFMVHGEEEQGVYLADKIKNELGIEAEVPVQDQVVEL
jgi:metallo-beta-lactamase family protein